MNILFWFIIQNLFIAFLLYIPGKLIPDTFQADLQLLPPTYIFLIINTIFFISIWFLFTGFKIFSNQTIEKVRLKNFVIPLNFIIIINCLNVYINFAGTSFNNILETATLSRLGVIEDDFFNSYLSLLAAAACYAIGFAAPHLERNKYFYYFLAFFGSFTIDLSQAGRSSLSFVIIIFFISNTLGKKKNVGLTAILSLFFISYCIFVTLSRGEYGEYAFPQLIAYLSLPTVASVDLILNRVFTIFPIFSNLVMLIPAYANLTKGIADFGYAEIYQNQVFGFNSYHMIGYFYGGFGQLLGPLIYIFIFSTCTFFITRKLKNKTDLLFYFGSSIVVLMAFRDFVPKWISFWIAIFFLNTILPKIKFQKSI